MAPRKPKCYRCEEKPVRKQSRFCSQRCAAEQGEGCAVDAFWCPRCKMWTEDTVGMNHGLEGLFCYDCMAELIGPDDV